jgi:hypothetical protein
LAALPPEVRGVVQAIIDQYERRIADLEAEISRLKKTPRNRRCRGGPGPATSMLLNGP